MSMEKDAKTPEIIVALDVESRERALELVRALEGTVTIFKVGSRLFTAEGPDMVRQLSDMGADIFLDLKLHDIPATVAGAVRVACGLGVKMMTIHTLGGREMMRAAAAEAGTESERLGMPRPLLVGVTVLTSLAREDLELIAPLEGDVRDLVLRLAGQAKEAGLDGVVASVQEAADIRTELGRDFVIVTPGIRPAGADMGDQKRIATPENAVESGSNFLVIGRPIIQAPSPAEAAREILAELVK